MVTGSVSTQEHREQVEDVLDQFEGTSVLNPGSDRLVPSARDPSLISRRAWTVGVSTFRVNRLIRPGSLKKMLFLTRSPRTCECSMVTRQASGAVPLQTHKDAQALLVGRGTAASKALRPLGNTR